MKKSDVIGHYGSITALCEALGIGKSAVSQWPELIPARRAYEIEILTDGSLKADRQDYAAKNKE